MYSRLEFKKNEKIEEIYNKAIESFIKFQHEKIYIEKTINLYDKDIIIESYKNYIKCLDDEISNYKDDEINNYKDEDGYLSNIQRILGLIYSEMTSDIKINSIPLNFIPLKEQNAWNQKQNLKKPQ